MKAKLLGREVQNSPEWDALRSNGLGGSEIAAVVGLSPWQSRYSLWHRKRGNIGKQEVNAGMAWGTRLEPVVCDAWAEQHPEFWSMEAGTYSNDERPWQLANVDRLLFPTEGVTAKTSPLGILEVKTAHTYDAWKWGLSGTDEIPPYYRCQVLWYMDALGVHAGHVAALIGGSDYREYVIPYVADEAEWLREQGRLFWQSVLDDKQPEIDSHTATYEAVRAQHPEIETGVEAEIDGELYAAYVISKATAETAKGEHQQIKSRLLDQMGEAQFAHVGGKSVLRRQSGRGGSVSLYEVKAPKESAA